MAITVLAPQQLGTHSTGGVWTPAVGTFTNLGPDTLLTWGQYNKAVPLVNYCTGLVLAVNTGWTETAILNLYTLEVPITRDFDTFNFPPTPSATLLSSSSYAMVAGSNNITYPLTTTAGKATILHGQMRARWRPHTSGQHRFALGLSWSGVGGVAALVSLTLTHDDEFTGEHGKRGVPGTDRAVRCPRCNTVVREAELVQDGFTLGLVCGQPGCYDPAEQAPRKAWPFR